MTEAEWMTSNDPEAMLRSLRSRYSAMKRRGETPDFERLRFFGCACCRRVWDLLDEDHRKSIEMIEAYCSTPTTNAVIPTTTFLSQLATAWGRMEGAPRVWLPILAALPGP